MNVGIVGVGVAGPGAGAHSAGSGAEFAGVGLVWLAGLAWLAGLGGAGLAGAGLAWVVLVLVPKKGRTLSFGTSVSPHHVPFERNTY